MAADFATLAGLGYQEILLWGSEYWLRRERQGDDRWLRAAAALTGGTCRAAERPAGG